MMDAFSHDDFKQSRETYWRRQLETWRESGQSQIQYCRERQLKIPTFRYWKAKLEQRNSPHPFLPVTIRPDTPTVSEPSPSGVSLFFQERFRIQLEIGFHPETLASLIDLLRG